MWHTALSTEIWCLDDSDVSISAVTNSLFFMHSINVWKRWMASLWLKLKVFLIVAIMSASTPSGSPLKTNYQYILRTVHTHIVNVHRNLLQNTCCTMILLKLKIWLILYYDTSHYTKMHRPPSLTPPLQSVCARRPGYQRPGQCPHTPPQAQGDSPAGTPAQLGSHWGPPQK